MLDLSHNGIAELGAAIFHHSGLFHLRLAGNRLASIPPVFSHSQLGSFPVALNSLASVSPLSRTLQRLDCMRYHFTELPTLNSPMIFVSCAASQFASLRALPEAAEVVFALNKFTRVPLCWSCIQMADFSHNVLQIFTLTPGLTSVDLSRSHLPMFFCKTGGLPSSRGRQTISQFWLPLCSDKSHSQRSLSHSSRSSFPTCEKDP
jgi:Leucine-rich repeat (LRR) protein